MTRFALALIVATAFAAGCSHPPEGPVDITGTSAKFMVTGKFAPVSIDRVDALSIDNGKLSIHGSSTTTEDIPADADAGKAEPHWSLTSENELGGTHNVTFTHDISLDDFAISLPKDTADLHYGTLKTRTGDTEVLLFAWGHDGKCYWGYLTIAPKPDAGKS